MRVAKKVPPPPLPALSDPALTPGKKGAVAAAIAFFQQDGCRVLPARDDLPFDPAAAEFRLVLPGNLAVLPVTRISLVERAVRRSAYLARQAAEAAGKAKRRRARGSGVGGR